MNEPVELKEEETKKVVGGTATAIEYGLISSLIGVAIIAGETTLGQAISDKMKTIKSTLTGSH